MLEQGLILVALLALSSFGLWLLRRRDGTFRSADRREDGARLTSADLGRDPAAALATFVLISSATCSTCPQVRRVLAEVTADVKGAACTELAAEDHMDLVRRLDVLRTPTVLLLDRAGVVRSRTSGPLRADAARAALAELLTPTPTPAVTRS